MIKKMLTILSSVSLTGVTSSNVVSCLPNSGNIFFSDPDKIRSAIEEIKAIDHSQISDLRDLDSKVQDILNRAVENLDSTRIIPGTVRVHNYYWFYSDESRSREVILEIDSDGDGISDFIGTNFAIKVDYQERDGFDRDFEDDVIYIYNTPINAYDYEDSFLDQFESVLRRPINVEFERRYSKNRVYSEVMEELSETLARTIRTNKNRTGFVGGFLHGIDVELDIHEVTNGRSISNGRTYKATLNTGSGLQLNDPLEFEVTFIRD